MTDTDKIITEYREFLEDVDCEAARLTELYSEHMVCRKGCSACCTDLSLLPLEWYALKEQTGTENPPRPDGGDERCALLGRDEACSFYPFRPLICRTHGLPLLYLIEEYDPEGLRVDSDEPEWQISWCDLNFTKVDEDSMEEIFEPEDVLNMEEWNIRLSALNREFLETPEGEPFRDKARIPLKDIFKD